MVGSLPGSDAGWKDGARGGEGEEALDKILQPRVAAVRLRRPGPLFGGGGHPVVRSFDPAVVEE